MLQLRVVCTAELTDAVVGRLHDDVGVVTLTVHRGVAVDPCTGDLVVADVVRERANAVMAALRTIGVERHGVVAVITIEALASEAARRAKLASPGHESDALPWALIEESARDSSGLSVTYLALMALAAIIAAVGVLVDSAVLIIGAMIVGPEYGPLVAIAVGLHRRRPYWRRAIGALVIGLAAAVAAAAVVALIARLAGEPTEIFDARGRFFTSFVTEPNLYSVVVALAAGIAGIIALARGQATAVAGVLVSVTTIPAAAAIGVDLAGGTSYDFDGATLQLAINVAALLVAGIATLAVYDWSWARRGGPRQRTRLP